MAAAIITAGCAQPGLPESASPDPSPATSAPQRSRKPPSSSPKEPPPGEPSPGESGEDESATGASFKPPAAPCRVLSARTRTALSLETTERDKRAVACQWSNDPGTAPPFRFRDLKVTYDPGFADTEAYAKESFKQKRAGDYRQPSVFGGVPAVKGEIRRVGTADAGRHFDEGYYVFFVYQVAGARRGEGRAVLRKGNLLITISASGADIPGRRVSEGRPIGRATAERMIDAVAEQVLAAVR